ncbi:hypothetical protein C7999DRAFT_35661 [Corynascus novoguineensis]|uniref:SKP1 component dimerisation domain-containing protein n=1 Tax=Corynascus novoguineensis TaxID=1126955 RepID=A0AAN7CKV9_9PEZI|nr:hypothetical protein C7999DRAFT_35661 [Corynascus novoguineensis]
MAVHPKLVYVKNTVTPSGHIFPLSRQAAQHSGVLRTLIEDFAGINRSQKEDSIPIEIDVSEQCQSDVLDWAEKTENKPVVERDAEDKEVKFTDVDSHFFHVAIQTSEMLHDLLVLTNYLDMVPLYGMACQVVIDMIMGKPAEHIRLTFGLESGCFLEHEGANCKETAWVYYEQQTQMVPDNQQVSMASADV